MREVFIVEESGHDFQDVVGVFSTMGRAARWMRRRYEEFADVVIELDAYMERKDDATVRVYTMGLDPDA